MEEFWIFTRYFINVGGGSDGRAQQRCETLVQAKKLWHQQIASDIDKATIEWELLQIIRSSDGLCIASEIIDHYIEPEPTPEPEPEPTPEPTPEPEEPEEPEEPTEPETPEEGE